jgi:hypothetical protein
VPFNLYQAKKVVTFSNCVTVWSQDGKTKWIVRFNANPHLLYHLIALNPDAEVIKIDEKYCGPASMPERCVGAAFTPYDVARSVYYSSTGEFKQRLHNELKADCLAVETIAALSAGGYTKEMVMDMLGGRKPMSDSVFKAADGLIPKEIQELSESDYYRFRKEAIHFQYLVCLNNRMASKSILDEWLSQKHNLTIGCAHEISNSVESERCFVTGNDGVTWLRTELLPDPPTIAQYPGLLAFVDEMNQKIKDNRAKK